MLRAYLRNLYTDFFSSEIVISILLLIIHFIDLKNYTFLASLFLKKKTNMVKITFFYLHSKANSMVTFQRITNGLPESFIRLGLLIF